MKKLQTTTTWGVLVLALALLIPASPAAAQGGGLKVSYTNLSLQHDSARARTQAASTALPGDTLRYELTFTNDQGRAIQDIVFNNPLPEGLALLGGTVTTSVGATVEYSIDHGVTYQQRPTIVIEENGRRVERVAQPDTYTHIRWTVPGPIAPNTTVTARYQVQVRGR